MLTKPVFTHPLARWLIYGAVAAFAFYKLAPFIQASDKFNGFNVKESLVPKPQIEQGGPPRDGIPALTEPAMLQAADASYLNDNDRVLAITLGGESRAYPINILNWHEVVNDTVGGHSLVISYCPLCGSGMVFDARVDGRNLEFGVSGLLYQSDMLLYDRQTNSLWSQLMAQAISGPLKGTRLSLLAADYTTWKSWQQQHPQGLVLDNNTGYRRDYDRNPYAGYENTRALIFEVKNLDSSFHEKEAVVGLVIDGSARVWPLSELEKVQQWPLEDSLNSTNLLVNYRSDDGTVTIEDASGQRLPTVPAYWFAWMAFYPESQIFRVQPEP